MPMVSLTERKRPLGSPKECERVETVFLVTNEVFYDQSSLPDTGDDHRNDRSSRARKDQGGTGTLILGLRAFLVFAFNGVIKGVGLAQDLAPLFYVGFRFL